MIAPPSVIAILGPTGVGKSNLAIKLAEHLDGEIISADSMQIYRGMDIGTGKVKVEERSVCHYGLDIANPGEPYSAALFQAYARDCIKDIEARGKRVIMCGGTGFYVRAALDDFDFPDGVQVGNPVRDMYAEMARTEGPEAVWEELRRLDDESAQCIHPNNTKRVIRALELHADGLSYAEQLRRFSVIPEYRHAVYIGLTAPRDILYERINNRVDEMLSDGLIDEVRNLIASGYETAVTAAQAIGYKEFFAYLHGDVSYDEAVESVKQATRRYAKRQLSWFKRDERVHWIDVSTSNDGGFAQACVLIAAEDCL